MKIAWIGCGVMGKAMLSHLNENEIHVYTRSLEKLKNFPDTIRIHDSIESCVKECDVIFTMVSYPSDVEEVYLGEKGILKYAKNDAILIDMTTSTPQLAQQIAQIATQEVLDAPVSGGDIGAKNGTLSIMVGGNPTTFNQILPLFEKMGKNIYLIGSHGCGQHCKMCNQIAVAGATAAYSEALIYMQQNELDSSIVLKAISGGAAGSWQLNNMAQRVLDNDFAPGFFIKHFTKDMRIAKEVMSKHNITLDMLESVYKMYDELEKQGYENLGTQALIKYYQK